MELHLKIIGVLLILLALVHIIFPRYFKWSLELKSLSLVNRQMIYVHTFFIALVLLLMGLLCFTSTTDLTHTNLGSRVCLGLGLFWLLRLITQFFGYSASLWKGKVFETTVHIVFAFTWTYFSSVFFYTFWLHFHS